ncbi:MAG: translation initiation factor IF-1 [Candidatus Wildermuthbacteria bacterium]|nr:translation initiation factor IF-1 [Candidatus Wildermuthbacteria bacterium]
MIEDNKEGRVVTGEIMEALPSLKFKVRLEDGSEILAYLAGKLRMFKIRILPGDKVNVMMSPYDNTRGRIVYRNK